MFTYSCGWVLLSLLLHFMLFMPESHESRVQPQKSHSSIYLLKRRKNMHMGNEWTRQNSKMYVWKSKVFFFSPFALFRVGSVDIQARIPKRLVFPSLFQLLPIHPKTSHARSLYEMRISKTTKNIKISAFVITSSYMHMVNDWGEGWWIWREVENESYKVNFRSWT